MGETIKTPESGSAVVALEMTARKARSGAVKELGGGAVKLVSVLSLPVLVGFLAAEVFGTSIWGPAVAIVAAEYGFPIFGRLLGSQFAVEDLTSASDWWEAVMRHYKKERIDLGQWTFEEKIQVKEKPQQGGETAPGTPQG